MSSLLDTTDAENDSLQNPINFFTETAEPIPNELNQKTLNPKQNHEKTEACKSTPSAASEADKTSDSIVVGVEQTVKGDSLLPPLEKTDKTMIADAQAAISAYQHPLKLSQKTANNSSEPLNHVISQTTILKEKLC